MKPMNQINVIPFIDIMLVLLAVVLTTATFVAQGRIPVTLPTAVSADKPGDSPTIELTVDGQGAYFLGEQQITLQGFAGHLSGVPTDTRVVVRVDATAEFAHFVAVVDLLKERAFANLSIATLRAVR